MSDKTSGAQRGAGIQLYMQSATRKKQGNHFSMRHGCQSSGYPSCDHDDVLNVRAHLLYLSSVPGVYTTRYLQLSNFVGKMSQPGYISVLHRFNESRGSVTRWDTRRVRAR
ncbi:hypothetical protein H112_00951 [Trichophyton rubrum D6]|uniref:Uncharacterized protein n=3 Tax=Trichophyton TaxID=5550 RepID=A0A080WLT0_TRIRC|nr:uncharacterized protein TERG_12542 [Trichophyton rubrum CBS 118892]EZF27002.1 hypothetical protein H100_00950 [Trichophyton rubrum MR850]EZF46045.1 hypothetical protein H102_00941 [Trichophyton rubrum CBS 100081]EZF56691.1 hypothetical protein H103_00949 [Trichophyton rubrum CBS 288.86]EZF67302.1 hypothetical protein H104_00933 [Trichophyton rubrum CBS 289.86]EZF77962.1 hypothetical protein H105_00948 [Trichophyton soudanense CBS 452.61]EZF88602.1 hypothetical protein H110_00950 [Trichophy